MIGETTHNRGGWWLVWCDWRRTYDERMPPYLLTVFVSGWPEARAVVDDFGTLVVVGGWR